MILRPEREVPSSAAQIPVLVGAEEAEEETLAEVAAVEKVPVREGFPPDLAPEWIRFPTSSRRERMTEVEAMVTTQLAEVEFAAGKQEWTEREVAPATNWDPIPERELRLAEERGVPPVEAPNVRIRKAGRAAEAGD